jgi:predicted  nucleic acid-binding Zn-ribbon protein
VWWTCSSCGHQWQALVSSRSVGNGCPRCARRRQRERGPRPVSKERSLAAPRPELVASVTPRATPISTPPRSEQDRASKHGGDAPSAATTGPRQSATVRTAAAARDAPASPTRPTDAMLGAKLSEHLHRVVDAGEGSTARRVIGPKRLETTTACYGHAARSFSFWANPIVRCSADAARSGRPLRRPSTHQPRVARSTKPIVRRRAR